MLYDFIDDDLLQILSSKFDEEFYSINNLDVVESNVPLLQHYLTYGWKESRDCLSNELLSKSTLKTGVILFDICKSEIIKHFSNTLGISNLAFSKTVQEIEKRIDVNKYSADLDYDLPNNLVPYHIVFTQYEPTDTDVCKTVREYREELTNMRKLNANEQFQLISSRLVVSDTVHIQHVYLGRKQVFMLGWFSSKQGLNDVYLTVDGEKVSIGSCHLSFERNDLSEYSSKFNDTNTNGLMIRFDIPEFVRNDILSHQDNVNVVFINEIGQISHKLSNTDVLTRSSLPTILSHFDVNNPLYQQTSGILRPIFDEIFAINSPVKTKINQFGDCIKDDAKVSIIIPIYGRYDFIRYQMSNFTRYKILENVEVIYVVDDPSIASEALQLSIDVHSVTGESFKLVTLDKNVGFARANNIGVDIASSESIVLLNSDVLPNDSEWLDKLLHYLDTIEDVGALGCRLLFEDDSIQHDGMLSMTVPQYPDLILNDHPQKGWPLSMAKNAAELAKCELLTAACLAMKKSLFRELGGFDIGFYMGDFEDSDLCQRALKAGKTNYIARDVTLYHLERQSQNHLVQGDWKHKITLINALLYKDKLAKFAENSQ